MFTGMLTGLTIPKKLVDDVLALSERNEELYSAASRESIDQETFFVILDLLGEKCAEFDEMKSEWMKLVHTHINRG